MKPILVILEGADKVGKTSTHKLLARETNHEVIITDRFTGAYIAYGEMNGTITGAKVEELYQTELKMSEIFDVLVVYLHADERELLERSKFHNELEEEAFYIKHIIPYYERYLKITNFNYVKINTSILSVRGAVGTIKDVLDIMREEHDGQ